MTENPIKIIWFEDSEKYIQEVLPRFQYEGIEVVAIIGTIEESLALLDTIDGIGISAALIDGNLLEKKSGKKGEGQIHGLQIARKIKERELPMKTIGYSTLQLSGDDFDIDIGKQRGLNQLITYLLSLGQ